MLLRKGDLDTPCSFRLPASQMEQVMKVADQMDASVSQTVRRLVAAGLTKMQEKQAA